MFDMTDNHILAVYNKLKDKYPLVLANSLELNEGYTIDCPVLVAKAHGHILELYSDGDLFVLDVMDEAQTKGTHWHPWDVDQAAEDITDFMANPPAYELMPFPKH